MEYRHELISFGDRVPVRCFISQLGHSGRHWHDSLELLFVLSGQVTIIVDGERYTLSENDVILVNANSAHELFSDQCTMVAIQIKLTLFDKNLLADEPLYFDCNSRTSTSQTGLLHIKKIIAQFVKTYSCHDESRVYRAKALSYLLLAELITYFRADRSEVRKAQMRQQNERINRIVNEISARYQENITLQQVAEQEYLSVPYLSRFFNRMMGMGFNQYLNRVRLDSAVSELIATGKSIDRIAGDNGFGNTQAFVQLFKKQYGMLPSQYRKQESGKKRDTNAAQSTEYAILDATQYLEYFARYLDRNQEEAYTEDMLPDSTVQAAVNTAAEAVPLRHTWKTFTSVGSARDLLNSSVQRMLARMQREIGFTYIKFHGLLSDDMHVCVRNADGSLEFSFVYVDAALDFLVSIGLKPMIQLGFMPRALARDPEHRIFESTMINSLPENPEEWSLLIRALTRHLLERYGTGETEKWPFTVWNEPDTPQSMFGFPSAEAFYGFYLATFRAVRGEDARIRIGAPSTYYAPESQPGWLRSFAAFCRENGCMPDFLPFHFYGTVMPEDKSVYDGMENIHMKHLRLSSDEQMLAGCISEIKALTAELFGPEIPVYLTEWNLSPSHRELLGDTCFRSCYLVKNILENMDRIGSMGYWTLTDLLEEHQVPAQLFHGGLGLFTSNGIAKAAFHALRLLARLGDGLVSRGDGWYLTRRGSAFQLMLYHYRHFSDLYAARETFDMTPENRYTCFGPEQRREYEIRLEGTEDGRWLATEYSISRAGGSAFDKWLETGGQPLETPEEAELLEGFSRPMISKYTLQASGGSLTVHANLEMLEVRLILLTR